MSDLEARVARLEAVIELLKFRVKILEKKPKSDLSQELDREIDYELAHPIKDIMTE